MLPSKDWPEANGLYVWEGSLALPHKSHCLNHLNETIRTVGSILESDEDSRMKLLVESCLGLDEEKMQGFAVSGKSMHLSYAYINTVFTTRQMYVITYFAVWLVLGLVESNPGLDQPSVLQSSSDWRTEGAV